MIYSIRTETTPNEIEQGAIACLKTLCDRSDFTREQVAAFLRACDVRDVHVGGHHVSINRDNCRVAVITSTHPDWN